MNDDQTSFNGTGSYPTGAYPTGGAQPGSYPTGAYPTGAYPTGAYPTGAYPTGAAPTGGYPGNAYPGGQQEPYQGSPYQGYQQSYPQPQPVQPQQPYQPANTYPYQVGGEPADPMKPQEKVKPPRREIDMERIVRPFVILGVPVMLVLFVLCMVLGSILWLKWTFIGLALCILGVMWLNRDYFQRDMILTFTVVLGALTLVCGVSAVTTPAGEGRTVLVTPTPAPVDPLAVGLGGDLMTAAPTEDPSMALLDVTPTPEPATAQDSGLESVAVQRMLSFLHYWSVNDMDGMINLCLPSWASGESEPRNSLYQILANRTPVEYEATAISGTDNDISRTVTTTITLNRNNNTSVAKYVFKIIMSREDEVWYIDPRSLESNVKATATPASAEITQPPTPAPVADDNVVLYYNPDGGTMYHIDANCKSTHSKYLPFKGQFTYGQLNDPAYADLVACSICGAPLRPGT